MKKLIPFSFIALFSLNLGFSSPNPPKGNPTHSHVSSTQNQIDSKSWYLAEHKDGTTHFIRVRVPGDGNCALHCLRKTRKEFVEKLYKHIKEPIFQKMIRDDLKNADIKPSLPQGQYSLRQYEDYIQKHLTKSSEYLSFVAQTSLISSDLPSIFTPDDQYEGSLAAAAALFKLNVRVWMPQSQNSIKLVAKYFNKEKGPFIDILFLSEIKHFDLLIDASHPEAVSQALQGNRFSR